VKMCPHTYFVRSAWLFGHTPNNYIERVLEAAENNGVVRIPDGQIESRSYRGHLVEAVGYFIGSRAYSILT